MKTNHTILITGASGFIGYNACNFFLKKDWDVYGLINNGEVPMGVKKIKTDLLDFKKLKLEIKKINPSVILHLGAYVVLERSFEVAQKCIDINIKGTLNLLESARYLNLRKFIFFSTEEVYGKNKVPYKENQSVLPPSPYAVSKIAAENLCLIYHKLHNLPVVILRIATIFGYYQPETRFIAGIITKTLKNEPILLNSGKIKRDYLFIEELIDVLDKVIKNKKANGEIFNIGHQNPISGYELAKKIVKISKSTSKIILNSFPDRIGESKVWSMNNNKALNILGWKSGKQIDKYLEKTINYYRN